MSEDPGVRGWSFDWVANLSATFDLREVEPS